MAVHIHITEQQNIHREARPAISNQFTRCQSSSHVGIKITYALLVKESMMALYYLHRQRDVLMFEVCRRCLMPNTRPNTNFKDGVCQACHNFDTRQTTDWESRLSELSNICDRHRKNGPWDCLIPVSGGKDSHAMVYWIKEVMGMNPLLVTVGDIFTKTDAGVKNYRNLGETFGCNQILFTINPEVFRDATRKCFERYLDPLRLVEQALMVFPVKVAARFGINLIIEGESEFTYGGSLVDKRSASSITDQEFSSHDIGFWDGLDIPKTELNAVIPPTKEEMDSLEVYWMSYFVPWSSVSNYRIARRYGFVDLAHEWKREGCIEDFEQIDSIAYLAHIWLKYPKFGFQRVSDIASRRLREGALSLADAKTLILEKDPVLDQRALDDFCNTLSYTKKEFWDIVDSFWNPKIFRKSGVTWEMKIDRFGGV